MVKIIIDGDGFEFRGVNKLIRSWIATEGSLVAGNDENIGFDGYIGT